MCWQLIFISYFTNMCNGTELNFVTEKKCTILRLLALRWYILWLNSCLMSRTSDWQRFLFQDSSHFHSPWSIYQIWEFPAVFYLPKSAEIQWITLRTENWNCFLCGKVGECEMGEYIYLRSWLTTSKVSSFFKCFSSLTTSARAFQSRLTKLEHNELSFIQRKSNYKKMFQDLSYCKSKLQQKEISIF